MFCPKCGSQFKQEATFCPKCGANLNRAQGAPARIAAGAMPGAGAARAVAGVTPSAAAGSAYRYPAATHSPSMRAAGSTKMRASSMSGMGIAACATAVITTVCMFMPWLEVPALAKLSGITSGFGISSQSEFPIFGLDPVVKTMDMLTGSSAFNAISMIALALWSTVLATLLAGLVVSFTKTRSTKPLAVGGALAFMFAIAWSLSVNWLSGQISSQLYNMVVAFEVPGAVAATAIFGLATVVLAIVNKGRA